MRAMCVVVVTAKAHQQTWSLVVVTAVNDCAAHAEVRILYVPKDCLARVKAVCVALSLSFSCHGHEFFHAMGLHRQPEGARLYVAWATLASIVVLFVLDRKYR